MKKILLFLQILVCAIPIVSTAQQKVVTGIVKDAAGPLPGVSVVEKGITPTNGMSTGPDGRFKLTLRGSSGILTIKSIGYTTREVKANTEGAMEVLLQPSSQGLDEVMVTGYGTVTRIANTGAISSISAKKIKDIPTSSVQNTLAGRVPGFFSQQRSGQPGKDASDFFIRGVSSLNSEANRPLIIVDDIEYTYNQLSQINVNEIESISILKDAATTAIYGIKGANGVLVVKTRRGKLGKPQMNLRVESGLQTPVTKPKFLDAYQTAQLRNEALSNDGLPAQFTAADLQAFQDGSDPFGHPNVNWYEETFKPVSWQANTNLDISGGAENVKYFISGGAFTQNGNVRDFSNELAELNSNYFYNRYNFRSNLDVQANKTLTLRLDLTGRFGEINQPSANNNLLGEIYNYERISPYGAPVKNPDGSFSYNRYSPDKVTTINSRLATQGYSRDRTTDFNIFLSGTQQLKALTPGLSATANVSYASSSTINRSMKRFNQPPAYLYDPATETYQNRDPGQYVLQPFTLVAADGLAYRSLFLQGLVNYDRTFGNNRFTGLLLLNQNSNRNRSDVPVNYRGYSLRVGYSYKNKYYIDFNNAYNGTDRFQDHYGYFPAISASWNISDENFIKGKVPAINLLKLRASYGLVGSDVVFDNRYLYIQNYNRAGNYSFGENPTNYVGIAEGTLGNPNVTWEKQKELNIGLDMNLFRDKVSLTVDWFHNLRYDQLINKNSVSQIIGVGLPRENLGRVQNNGVEGQINYRPNIGFVQLDFGFVLSYAKNKILFQDEAYPDFPYLRRTGQSLNQPFGYTWIGFYKDEHDIAVSAKPNLPVRPGDLKYQDLNNDGLIDQNDMGPIGRPNLPSLTMGAPIGIHYKGFDASILFQGSFNYSLLLNSYAIEPFQSNLQPIHMDRWTPETANSASFPRLTTLRNTINSAYSYPSNFWQIDANFIRLKTVEFGYQFPSKWLPFKINNARLYFSGYNLYTWTNYKLYQQDPEIATNTAGDSYLNQRVFNLGFQVGF